MSVKKETDEGAARPLPPVWVYGINDHLDLPAETPSGFEATGTLSTDFRAFCEIVGAAPHPAFKVRKKVETVRSFPIAQPRRPSLLKVVDPEKLAAAVQAGPPPEEKPHREGPNFSARSVLLDRTSMGILSLVLPACQNVKVLCFSDCNLDCEMLKLLATGLSGSCSVESLQIEWNCLDLPLPTLTEEDQAKALRPADDEDAENENKGVEALNSASASFDNAARLLEARERKRYSSQSERLLRNFCEWMESTHGSLEAAWSLFDTGGVDCNAELQAADFHVLVYEKLGLSGSQVLEVFDVLDGPDYGADGVTCLNTLKMALEGLSEEPPQEEADEDPLGLTLSSFLGTKVLESFSVRASGVSRLELVSISAALAKCPWQLRSLNLWENRICDRGAELLASALDVYRGLEYLGLGRNRISDTGLQSLCRPFMATTIDQAEAPAARDRIAKQEAAAKAVADAKEKAQNEGTEFSGRQSRAEVPLVDELEEIPPAGDAEGPTFKLLRGSALRCLVLSENPIKSAEVLETLQPLGPRGVELVLRCTPAAAELGAKRPELLKDKERRPLLNLTQKEGPSAPAEGWVLRLTPY